MFLLNLFLWLWYGPEQYERMKQTEKKMNTGLRYKTDACYELDRIFKTEKELTRKNDSS